MSDAKDVRAARLAVYSPPVFPAIFPVFPVIFPDQRKSTDRFSALIPQNRACRVIFVWKFRRLAGEGWRRPGGRSFETTFDIGAKRLKCMRIAGNQNHTRLREILAVKVHVMLSFDFSWPGRSRFCSMSGSRRHNRKSRYLRSRSGNRAPRQMRESASRRGRGNPAASSLPPHDHRRCRDRIEEAQRLCRIAFAPGDERGQVFPRFQ